MTLLLPKLRRLSKVRNKPRVVTAPLAHPIMVCFTGDMPQQNDNAGIMQLNSQVVTVPRAQNWRSSCYHCYSCYHGGRNYTHYLAYTISGGILGGNHEEAMLGEVLGRVT
jgi:hypothetical protein